MIHLGFTGTRHGMTREQLHNVRSLVVSLKNANAPTRIAAHHGDCVGADAEFHAICRALGCWLVIHPGPIGEYSAGCVGDERHDPLPHMQRNRAIVASSAYMIGAPFEMERQKRGGTWATIGMAELAEKRVGKSLIVVLPHGALVGAWDCELETMIGRTP